MPNVVHMHIPHLSHSSGTQCWQNFRLSTAQMNYSVPLAPTYPPYHMHYLGCNGKSFIDFKLCVCLSFTSCIPSTLNFPYMHELRAKCAHAPPQIPFDFENLIRSYAMQCQSAARETPMRKINCRVCDVCVSCCIHRATGMLMTPMRS